MRYVAIEPVPEGDLVRELEHNEVTNLLVDKGVHPINAKGLVDYLPCGVRLSIGGTSVGRIA
jgi:hypothetical protein